MAQWKAKRNDGAGATVNYASGSQKYSESFFQCSTPISMSIGDDYIRYLWDKFAAFPIIEIITVLVTFKTNQSTPRTKLQFFLSHGFDEGNRYFGFVWEQSVPSIMPIFFAWVNDYCFAGLMLVVDGVTPRGYPCMRSEALLLESEDDFNNEDPITEFDGSSFQPAVHFQRNHQQLVDTHFDDFMFQIEVKESL